MIKELPKIEYGSCPDCGYPKALAIEKRNDETYAYLLALDCSKCHKWKMKYSNVKDFETIIDLQELKK